MENFFNRKVGITHATNGSRMNPWTLSEFDQDGKVVGKELIPWTWSLHFNCTSLSVVRSVSDYRFFHGNESEDEPKKTVRINGEIVSTGGEWNQALDYSFLGTDRRIEIFRLEIIVTKVGEPEQCVLVASPKFEYESDRNFSQLVSDDQLSISLRLKSERVEEIARLVDQNILNNVSISIGKAEGLFSQWSPTIYTDFIKVLPDGCEIQGLSDTNLNPKFVGKVGEFSLVYKSKDYVFRNESEDERSEQDKLEEASSDQKEWLGGLIANAVAITSSSQKSLLVPLWLIFTMLLFLLFK